METEPFVPFTIEVESLEELSVLFHALGSSNGYSLFKMAEREDKKPIMNSYEYATVCYKLYRQLEPYYRRSVEGKR